VRSQCRQPARARLRKTAGGQVRNLPLLVRGGQVGNLPLLVRCGQVGNLPLLVRGGQVGNLPLLVRGGQVGNLPLLVREREGRRGGDAIPPSSPRGGEEGEQGKSEGRRRQPARARLRKTAGGQVRNLPLLVRGGQVGNLPLLVRGGQVGNLPLPVREREGRRGERCYPPRSSPRGGEEGEQGKSEGRRRQPARARLRKTAGGQVRNLPLLVRGGQVGNLPLLVRPGGRLETRPYWYGQWAGWKPAPPGAGTGGKARGAGGR